MKRSDAILLIAAAATIVAWYAALEKNTCDPEPDAMGVTSCNGHGSSGGGHGGGFGGSSGSDEASVSRGGFGGAGEGHGGGGGE